MISIWWLILFVAVVAVLATALFFTIKGNLNLQKDVEYARIRAEYAEREWKEAEKERGVLEKRIAFNDGLNAGRQTDVLYRQILKKVKNNEQFTVMMNGVGDEQKEGDN